MDFYIAEIPWEATLTLTVVAVLVAAWRGGVEERVGGAIIGLQGINEYVEVLAWSLGPPTDLMTLAGILPLVLLGRRYWTIWALASVILSLVTDVLNSAMELDRWAYLSAQLTWYWVLAGSLLVGGLTRRRATAPSGP